MAAAILIVTGPSGVGKSAISGLVSTSFERGARVCMDDVERLIVAGRVEQSSPGAGHQNHVVGGAVVAAAMQFAVGGYTTVIDGVIFPDVLPELVPACASHGVELHYAVLRAEFEVCLERVMQRNEEFGFETDVPALRLLYDRFSRLGDYEAHLVDASDSPDAVASAALRSYQRGLLRVLPR
jgi:predicted ABC-type ATPase